MSEILQALSARGDTAVICAAPGVSTDSVKAPVRAGFQLLRRPVRLPALLSEASLFISYGPAASVAESLLSGVPQLVSPAHVEAQMTAARVQAIGAGLALKSDTPEPEIRSAVQKILHDATYKDRALEFANRYRGFNGATVADQLVDGIVQLAEGKAAELLALRGTG